MQGQHVDGLHLFSSSAGPLGTAISQYGHYLTVFSYGFLYPVYAFLYYHNLGSDRN